MRAFSCGNCGQLVFFDNNTCLRCGSALAFRPSTGDMVLVGPDDVRCDNHGLIGCSWLVEDDWNLCRACRLTRTRPPATDLDATHAWGEAEAAKRMLVFQALELGLDLSGLTFDLMSSTYGPVVTGHANGVITIDVNEADDVVRTRMRERMGEAYRTLLGHFRHEFGHYLWMTLVDRAGRHEDFRGVFGDERTDYARALQDHYDRPAPDWWQDYHVSEYASAHPWEDFAETLAHYLHIRDVLQTAASFGLRVEGAHPALNADPHAVVAHDPDHIQPIIDQWLPLTYALNAVNRSMGTAPLYPFILAPAVIGKLDWVHRLIESASAPASAGG